MLRTLLPLLILVHCAAAQSIDTFFKDTFEQMVAADPEYATAIGRHQQDDRWTDQSKAARDHRKAFFEERLKTLGGFQLSALSPQNQLTARLVKYDFRLRLDAWELETDLLRVGQLFGFHNRLYTIVDRMPARTVHDYENLIARLNAVPALVDQNLTILDEAIASQTMQPRVVADLVIQQLATQMNQSASQTELLAALRKFPPTIPPSEQERLRNAAVEAYSQRFVPAWHKLHDYMVNTYLPHVRPVDSLSSMPGGRKAYAILVRRLTTTDISPEEIHSLGEHEVARIEKQMQAILTETGFKGSLQDFAASLEASPEQHFKSKDEMLAYCRNIAKIIEPELPGQFRHIPVLLYGVRAIPPDREAATATNAQSPSPDFTTPGWFNLNTYRPEKQVKYDKQSLVLHEAVPGHIFQGTIAQTQANLPDLRKFYSNSAYGEGWALYVESLGAELGLYKDPYSRFGQLASERFRAARLVVDTGIHELGWTRAQALDYFHSHAPEIEDAEIDRYISWPGQALSYKMGELRIRALRTKAEQQLGDKFDVRDFHDVVLRGGRLPLDLLTGEVNSYLSAQAH